jgi:RNA polymerase sigma factor (TIGR02999 family)
MPGYHSRLRKDGRKTVGDADTREVTDLLRAWGRGDDAALEKLLSCVYGDLRRMAKLQLANERAAHTLQPTALVHEVYIRLSRDRKVDWRNRAHFFGACARMMRRILVDHARRRRAGKRAGLTVGLSEAGEQPAPGGGDVVDVLALDRALETLEHLSARQCKVVEMRFFAGLSIEETAEGLGIAPRTVKLDWTKARAWLHHELTRGVR